MQKLGRYMYNIDMVKYSVVDCCKDIGVPSLVQLGDLYTFNITFERQEDNIPNKVLAFFDFQQAFEGNPAFDMARLIAACTDADIRRHLEEFIFDYYYEKLTKYMTENKKKPGFTVDQFKTAYNYALINQATWIPMMAMVALSGDVSEDTKRARIARCTLRARLVLEDAVKRLEVLQPTWINGA
uniref:Uncharacterized protein n=1 Tax=Acrobeloides nanus TaxID=290746 RepID=A0A914ECM7_9BILA